MKRKGQQHFDTCQVIRRKLVRHHTLNMVTGEEAPGHEEWVTEPCGTPLFSDKDREKGECRACQAGWTHENNYRVE